MADGWRCPECHVILAPHVSEHRCDPPDAAVPAATPAPPYSPSAGTAVWPSTGTAVYTTTGSGGAGGSGGWYATGGNDSVTVTAHCGGPSLTDAVVRELRRGVVSIDQMRREARNRPWPA